MWGRVRRPAVGLSVLGCWVSPARYVYRGTLVSAQLKLDLLGSTSFRSSARAYEAGSSPEGHFLAVTGGRGCPLTTAGHVGAQTARGSTPLATASADT